MGKVDFSQEIFSILSESEKQEPSPSEDVNYQFPLWDILKEIDRRDRRADRDRGKDIREYMEAHPAVVEKVRKKHGL